MSYYQKLIREIAVDVNPAGVEASMRLNYGTLSSLPREVFADEVKLARECETAEPGFLKMVAGSYGMQDDFDKWEAEAV